MAESFSAGDLVEVISAASNAPVQVGYRGTVMNLQIWGPTHVCVDYGLGEPILSHKECIRKIRPPQDWVKLCHLDGVKQREPTHV